MSRVIISGLGVVSPVGIGKDAFWQNLLNGVSGAIPLDRVTCCSLFGHHEFGAQVVCEASDFDPGTHHVPPTYHSADRFIVMLAGAAEAPITPITIAAFDVINCLSPPYRPYIRISPV